MANEKAKQWWRWTRIAASVASVLQAAGIFRINELPKVVEGLDKVDAVIKEKDKGGATDQPPR